MSYFPDSRLLRRNARHELGSLSLFSAFMHARPPFRIFLLLAVLLLGAVPNARAVEYQWAVAVNSVVSDETKGPPRAYLWIPPDCGRVRAVVVGQHNMLEEGLLAHPAFRAALAELGFAAVWITPAIDGVFHSDRGAGGHFETMLADLAAESGYAELAQAPVVPVGHSAMASYPYHFAAWNPIRTLAAISLKGNWPGNRGPDDPEWTGSDVAGVPLLFVSGEYEWADERAGKALAFRRDFPSVPFSMLADAGGGHFDLHDELVVAIANYLRKAARYRLPASPGPLGEPVTLRPIDATREGWLVDRWRQDKTPAAPAGAVRGYAGDAGQAFWCFDEEHARSTERLQAAYAGRKSQLVGYRQGREIVEQNPKTHQQVTLKFSPDPDGDGLTFRLTGAFLDKVPEGRPARWTGKPAGSPIDHASGGGPVVIRRICGPVEKLSDDTFALRFDRLGFDNAKRSGEIWLLAEHFGDATFKRAVQQAVLHFPRRNTSGEPQTIEFPPIPDQAAGSTAPISLRAASSAGPEAKVRYYVREGPAELDADGETLHLTKLPPRAKLPVKVTVVAWQWGRSSPPYRQSAEPVAQTFLVSP